MSKQTLRDKIERLMNNTGKWYMAYGEEYRADRPDSERTDQILQAIQEWAMELIGEDEPLSHGVDMITIFHYNRAKQELRAKVKEDLNAD